MEPIFEAEPIVENIEANEAPKLDSQPEQITPPKKRRGRPPKNPIPENAIDGEAKPINEKPKRRSKIDASAVAKQIQGLHMLAAHATGLSELQISEGESVLLADAVVNMSSEYGLELSGKTGAALQLFAACAMVYLPRFSVINAKMKAKKREKEQQTIIENGNL